LEEIEQWVKSSKWKMFTIDQGVRIFEQAENDGSLVAGHGGRGIGGLLSGINSIISIKVPHMPPPCLRVNIPMAGSATEIFMAVMNLPAACRTGIIETLRVVETIDNYTDIIHLSLEAIYLAPSWTGTNNNLIMTTLSRTLYIYIYIYIFVYKYYRAKRSMLNAILEAQF
jgi:hypothetical protein